jgi:Fe-S cluster assembly protein SufD
VTDAALPVAHTYAPEQAVAAARGRGEPDWLVRARAEAARAFAALPVPTPASRPWKYTDVTGLAIDSFAPDGQFAMRVEGAAPEGGFAGSISDALLDSAHAAVLERTLGSVVPTTEGKFIAANAGLWSSGAFVRALRGRPFAAPVTVHVEGTRGAIFPRLLVVAEPGSEAVVIVRASSGEAPLLAPGVVEVIAEADSRVRLLFDLHWGRETREFTTVRVRAGRGADVQVATLAMGGAVVKQHVEGLLEGEGAVCTIRGVAVGDGTEHFDFVTLQDHIGPRTVSDVEIKTALAGASKSIYYGVTRVEETAAGAEANQENRNLLLSKRAKADADPVLEILTNEVIRCGHGATVGPVDRDSLFYLQSRGLDRRQALTLLVVGFFQSVLGDVAYEGLAEELTAEVKRKLAVAELA